MTEAEWSQCDSFVALLSYLQRQVGVLRTKRGRRKIWLFIAACLGSSWRLLSHEGRAVVALLERHADVTSSQVEFKASQEVMFAEYKATIASSKSAREKLREWLAFAIWQLTIPRNSQEAVKALYQWEAQIIRSLKEWHRFAHLIREIFGNPFRPVAVDPGWLTPKVVTLAHTIYDKRAFDRLPVLADALEDAGCHETDIFDHCRRPGVHVRGCWVVDLVLLRSRQMLA